MKKIFPLLLTISMAANCLKAQVVQLSNNTNLTVGIPINATKAIFIQPIEGQEDFNLWVTDGTKANTQQLNVPVTLASESAIAFLNNKVYFSGINDNNGAELWVTDGTVAGTSIVKDINNGPSSSDPRGLVVFNNSIYFFENG